ncbi:MAG: chromosome segregation protein SMC [Chloroflexi bacterium]|nr:chromosome segregation protein SMC [Chloroflexota bacterium]
MYLRRVEAYGFKSFADRQVFEFGPGLTAVVGPNGSGKSNVADAIRWALGEQSSRSIRARKTGDVIFSGSDTRRELGVAEVTLILDNSEQWMPIDFDEVSVSRRAYRSGENEYRINGQKVRLLDVQDLFRRAQVGQNSYAMMSQGLVDEVLGLRPQERRNLIEEAAEVHGHRIELTRAERRLTQTRDNLGHVRVLIRELAPRLRQLERQSQRASRFRELDAQLGAALEAWYETELREASEALAAAQARHDQRSEAFAAARRQAEAFAPEIAAAERAVAAARAELGGAQRRERELAERSLALGQQRALAEQRQELLLVRRAEIDAAIEELEATPGPDAPDDVALVELDARVAEARAGLEGAQEAMRAADEAVRDVLRDLAEAEARRSRIETTIRDAEARRARVEAEQRRRDAERREAGRRRDELNDELRDYGKRALAARREHERLMQQTAEALRRREIAERRIEETRTRAEEGREAQRSAITQREQLEARRELTVMLAAQLARQSSASQELLRAANEPGPDEQPLGGVVGLLGRLIRVPQGLEHAIEAALAEQIGAIVVERQDEALAAIAHLREQGAGSVTVLPLDSIDQQYPLNMLSERGVLGVASMLVKTQRKYRPLVDLLLGRTIVVEDVETALKTVKRGLGSVVTRDGVLVRADGSIYGGSRGSAAEQFVLQDEEHALPEAIEGAREAEEAAAAQVQHLDDIVADARDALDAARSAATAAEAALRAHEQDSARLRRRLVAIGSELRLAHAVLADDDPAAEPDDAEAAIERERAALEALDVRLAGLRDRSEAVGAERDAAGDRVAQRAAALAAAEGERSATRDRQAALEEAHRGRGERLAERRDQALVVRQELEDLDLTLRDLGEQVANVEIARRAAEEAVAPAHAALADAERAERELTATRGDSQARLFAAERELLEAQSALRELANHVQSLERQIADDGLVLRDDGSVRRASTEQPQAELAGGDAAEPVLAMGNGAGDGVGNGTAPVLPAPVPASGGAEVDTVELRERISELRAEIRALGPVNLEALDDLGEERERHDFLAGQVEDLEEAEAQLRTAIAELKREIRERFGDTFEHVNQSFADYFQRFFGGGRAELTIVEPEQEGGEAGVDVRAQPPGKRISSLSMLSGGERALTSVALLFALLDVNPAPVCVLDEVDAALDEANVGRFVETLRGLCEHSQFIVITHNRGTVESADTIYGISMGDDSVSRVLSLRLADLPQAS